MLEHKMMS